MSQDSQCYICSITQLLGKELQMCLPDFQRGYVWDETQWGQLWDDVSNLCGRLMESGSPDDLLPQHFLGVITLKRADGGTYAVLDGQQRLTTIAMLLDCLEAMGAETVNRIRFTGGEEASRATHGKEINDYINLGPKTGRKDGPTVYEQCCTYFLRRVTESAISPQTARDVVMNRLFLLVQMVDEDPHDVFESLNATGVALDFGDFLLNVLLERADKERKERKKDRTPPEDNEIKERWLGICKSIADAKAADTDAAEDDDAESAVENDDSEDFDAENDSGTKDGAPEDAPCSPLKLKKFLNALHRLTLPFAGAIPETVEAFEACFYRLDKYFNKQDSNTVSGVLDALERWAGLYRRVINPQRKDCEKYGFDLYYAGIVCTSAYIPMLMRALYQCEVNKTWKPEQATALFGAVVRFELFAEVYHNERDGSAIASGRNLLPWLDEIVYQLSLSDLSSILQILVADWDNYAGPLSKDLDGKKPEDTTLSSVYYSSRFSRLMLSIDYVESCNKIVPDTFFGPVQVEHMIAQVPEGFCFEDYGFDSSSVNSLYNLILLEQPANNSIKNDRPEVKLLRLLAFGDDEKPVSALFRQYYYLSAEYYALLETEPKKFKELQSERIGNLLRRVACFMLIENEPKAGVTLSKGNPIPLLCMERDVTGQIVSCAPVVKGGVAGAPTEAKPWLVLNERKIELIPTHTKESPNTVVLLKRGADPESCKVKGGEGLASQMAKGLICGCGANALHKWLKICNEEIRMKTAEIENSEKGDDEKRREKFALEKPYGIWRQMFGAAKEDMPYSRESNTKNDPNHSHALPTIEEEGNTFCYRAGFNVSDIVRAFKTLYRQIEENDYGCGICLDFALAYEPTEQSFVFADNKLLRTNIGYLGKRDLYAAYVAKKVTGIAAPTKKGKRIYTCDPYFHSETVSFGDLLNHYKEKLRIPMYQRRYVWGTPQWEELAQRLEQHPKLGTIILYREEGGGAISVVDGQQRLSTLAMAAAAMGAAVDMPEVLLVRTKDVRNEGNKFFAKRTDLLGRLMNCTFQVLWIENATQRYQYEVFASVNGKGKKLTNEERAKNLLMKRFPNNNKEWIQIKNFTECPGFLQAFLERTERNDVSEKAFYPKLKRRIKGEKGEWNELTRLYDLYRGIHESGKGWFNAYRMLGVTTGDALLLDLLENNEGDVNAQEECRHLMMVYFLLYALKGTANDRKSINRKLPKLVGRVSCQKPLQLVFGDVDDDILISQLATSHKADAETLAETVWKNLCEQNITSMRREAAGFLLLSLENWMDASWKEGQAFNIDKKTTLEIEHICPVSDAKWPNGVPRPRLYALENLCLLEKTINVHVSDKMLTVKNGDGKLQTNAKSKKTYSNSSLKMPKMFYTEAGKVDSKMVELVGELGVFSAEKAKTREGLLHDAVINGLTEALEEILPN